MSYLKKIIQLKAFHIAMAGTALVLGAFFFSIIRLVQYWSLAIECTSCLDSFFANFTSSSNLWFLALLIWSAFGVLQAIRFFLREYRFHQSAKACGVKVQQVHLIDEIPLAAWSSGFFNQQICVNTTFWGQLSLPEQKALIAHESHHIREQHTLAFFLIGWTKAIIPFPYLNRLLDELHRQMRLRSEYEADNNAIQQTSRTIVASLLYKALSFESKSSSFAAARIDSFVVERVKNLTNTEHQGKGVERENHHKTVLVLSLFGASFLFVSLSAEMITSCLK